MQKTKLAVEDQARVEMLVQDAETDKNQAQQLALDASMLLRVSKTRLKEYKDSGFFKRCFDSFSGKHGEFQRATDAELIAMQKIAFAYLHALQKQGLLLAQSIELIRRNLLAVGKEVEEIYSVVEVLIEKFNVRTKKLEHITAIHDWLLLIQENGYLEYPKYHRTLKVTFDFFRTMQKNEISYERIIHDPRHLEKAFRELGIPTGEKIKIIDFVALLIDEMSSESTFATLSSFREITQLRVNDVDVPSDFILENLSGYAYSSIYTMLPQLTHFRELQSIPEAREVINSRFQKVIPNQETEYSLFELAHEILAGCAIAEDLFRARHFPQIPMGTTADNTSEVDVESGKFENIKIERETKLDLLNAMDDESEKKKKQIDSASRLDLSMTQQNELLAHGDEKILIALAGNPSIFEGIQDELAKTGSPSVRSALALNPKLTEALQDYLASTGSRDIKCELAKNSSLSKNLRDFFSSGSDEMIRSSLASNQAIDVQNQLALLNHPENESQYMDDHHPICVLARNPSLAPDVVSSLLDLHADVRVHLASNPSLTDELFDFLFEKRLNNSGEHSLKQSIALGRFKEKTICALARNKKLPTAMQHTIFASRDLPQLEALACNESLSEVLQAQLIDDARGNILHNLALNPTLTAAQQARLADIGDDDVRLNLADNVSLNIRVKSTLVKSFSDHDLRYVQGRFQTASDELNRLNDEANKAEDVFYSAQLRLINIPFFDYEEKERKLENASKSARKLASEADRKSLLLYRKAERIQRLLQLKNG